MLISNSKHAARDEGLDLLQKDQFVVFGQRGIYHVEGTEEIEFGGTQTRCYLLAKVFSKSFHKTFVPVRNVYKEAIRELAAKDEISNLEMILYEVGFDIADRKINSMKKIDFYNQVIHEGKFTGLVKAYLGTVIDLIQNVREEKKLRQYSDKLRDAILEEISFVGSVSRDAAEGRLRKIVAMFSGIN